LAVLYYLVILGFYPVQVFCHLGDPSKILLLLPSLLQSAFTDFHFHLGPPQLACSSGQSFIDEIEVHHAVEELPNLSGSVGEKEGWIMLALEVYFIYVEEVSYGFRDVVPEGLVTLTIKGVSVSSSALNTPHGRTIDCKIASNKRLHPSFHSPDATISRGLITANPSQTSQDGTFTPVGFPDEDGDEGVEFNGEFFMAMEVPDD
jgi:hypothetical protein